ncbi:hypothetical protein F511_45495 [Dorcoceras hygrometricum]|uniref:Uncharacterized protein n=1 Tax=Dorcoceras hygrometricum TaxID=472368 RepID=A0A2Z7A3J8_9LAMI|nr:hypothetical protein F511_45495 [Dorcoceras hygrometricum]
MLTSSLLLVATSSRHADVIIAESRFLFASNPSDLALLIPDIYCSSSFFDISSADFIDSVPDHIFACGLCYSLRNGPTSKTHST